MLGAIYYKGRGVPVNYPKAIAYLNKAASNKHPKAIYLLGSCCFNGQGTPKDLQKAISFFRTAANLGDQEAIQALKQLGVL